jgi:aspartate racemase
MSEPGNGRILGVLGGMGPLASAHFMLRLTQLTPAQRDQDHIPAVLWSDPRVPDRPAARRGAGPDPLPWLVHGLQKLAAAGCGAVAIPCNLAHAWFDRMQAASPIPILHIIDAAAADLRRQEVGPGLVGVVGTEAMLAMRLYQDRLEPRGWRCVEPSAEEMTRLITPAIALVKANRLAEAYQPFADALASLRDRGAQAIVLGCTEIPLGLAAGPWEGRGVKLVDTIDALARASIAWARSGQTH